MPKDVKCFVKGCKNKLVFRFPKSTRKLWLEKIGRPNDDPKPDNGLCADHFSAEDLITEGFDSGAKLVRKRLRKNAVPSLNIPEEPQQTVKNFLKELQNSSAPGDEDDLGVSTLPPDEPSSAMDVDADDSVLSSSTGELSSGVVNVPSVTQFPEPDLIVDHQVFNELDCGSEFVIEQCTDSVSHGLNTDSGISGEDTVGIGNSENVCSVGESAGAMNAERTEEKQKASVKKTSSKKSRYDIHDFEDNPQIIKYFTGLESFSKFMFVFQSLRTDLFKINYRDCKVTMLSLENQFFLTLWKLRRNTPDLELGVHFGVSRTTVSNIFISFVSFMTVQWGKISIWPSRSLTDYFMPDSFKKAYPSTRVIIDGTEVPIPKPSNPRYQQATFSTYKNKNTVKVLVGANPCGLISYVSPAYGGSTSDRQIVERSTLKDMCQRGDSIMADRGFNVQDMFAPKGIAINIPAFLKGKDHLSGATLMEDRKLDSERVHIERLIGFTKTYKMLAHELNSNYVPIASEIFYACVMLCNFRENIVSHDM